MSAALMWGGIAVLIFLVYRVVSPFLVPLAWACVLAVLTYPTYATLAVRWGPSRSAALTTIAAALMLIAPAVLLTTAFVREMLEMAAELQNALGDVRFGWAERAWAELQRRIPAAANVNVAAMGADALRSGAAFLMAQSGSIFRNVAGFLIDLTLSLFATFFLLRDADPIMTAIRRLLPMEAEAREALIRQTRDLVTAGVISSAVVAGLQGLLGGIAFAIVGIGPPVFWGVIMAFFCLLPFGAWVVWLPAAAMLAANGATTRALVLVGIGLGVVSSVDNLVRPMLLSGRAHMNGLVIFVSLLGGISAFGLLGLVLGPVLVATALALLTTHINDAPR